MSSQKWLTSHSKYKNKSAGVGDSVATAPTKHPCLTGKAAQFYIIIHTEVGPSEDHQLSVDDLINLFTYFNDYLSILIITIITIIINTIVINR